jgi:6-phosphogluconate dehydrogenase
MTTATADIGLIGLAVMGQNLALNMADHGFKVAVYNRTTATMQQFLAEHPPSSFGGLGGGLIGVAELKAFVAAIKRPRRIVIMVKAGVPTDAVIDSLVPLLEQGDIIIDGGNALYTDTNRREAALKAKGLRFVGSGVSGGEEGARFGPSLMPGGDPESWDALKPVWTAIAAKVDPGSGKPLAGAAPGRPVNGGVACTTYIGPGGSGHFVKMVHNGIEYADMQLIAEVYHFMREGLGMPPAQMAETFSMWNKGELDSFLIEITADILRHKDGPTGQAFVEIVLDAAGQKGTGQWTTEASLDLGAPAPTLAEAVFARSISALKSERVVASGVLAGPKGLKPIGSDQVAGWVAKLQQALYCSKICAYAQGFAIMSAASQQFAWNLKLGEVASIFRGGCIIRARFLQKITEAYQRRADLPNLLKDVYFAGVIEGAQANWRAVVAEAALRGIAVPALSSALAYFDSYRTGRLPANLIQAQRDYFGAHTYERVDRPRGEFFHVDWPDPKRPEARA